MNDDEHEFETTLRGKENVVYHDLLRFSLPKKVEILIILPSRFSEIEVTYIDHHLW